MKHRFLILAAAVVLLAGPAKAASFDCRQASNADEIAICDSRELSQLDVKMATLYDTIIKLVGMGVRGAIQDQQRAWLQERAGCGGDRACIRRLYDTRIRALEAEVARIAKGGPY
ncbi:MAG: lysozyme inhibitor LprI family protein [Xanthobacteraceae bacterium]|nr:lysozyme inhibitor LprI family protein [Xanthobacteraceae bacterium]